MRPLLRLLPALVLLLSACVDRSATEPDAGMSCEPGECPTDAGAGADAGGPADAGAEVDGGEPGEPDAGDLTDAGAAMDAGEVDAGAEVDGGGEVDAGDEVDAGGGELLLYTEDFDGLPSAPTNADIAPAVFLEALPGWALENDNDRRRANRGAANTAAIYSFGSDGSDERALGGVAGGASGTQYWGFCYTNTTGHRVVDLTLAYTGEQWRAANAVAANTLRFHYTRSATIAGDLPAHLSAAVGEDPTMAWVTEPALNFVSPIISTDLAIVTIILWVSLRNIPRNVLKKWPGELITKDSESL